MHRNLISSALAMVTLLGAAAASAESTRAPAEPRTGLELLVETDAGVVRARGTVLRGVAYEVLGIARLRPLAGALVRARCGGPWVEARTGPRGEIEVEVPVPAEPELAEDGAPRLEVSLRDGRDHRDVEIPVTLQSPYVVVARADRRVYRPGESVHLWARVVDRLTGRPVRGVPVTFDGGAPIRTSAAGVASHRFVLPNPRETVYRSVEVRAGAEPLETVSSIDYRVGERPTTDLFVDVTATPEVAAPGAPVSVRVQVRSPSGFPVQGAAVRLRAGDVEHRATTDLAGLATLELVAPAYSAGERGRVTLRGEVRHPGYGMADLTGGFTVRGPDSLDISTTTLLDGLVPEVDERLVISVFSGDGRPAAGARVVVRGAALAGGAAAAVVDRHGFAAVPMRVRAGTAARHIGQGPCSDSTATSLVIAVEGDTPQETRVCVPVLEDALVAPSVASPAVAPGEEISVRLARRPAATRRPVLVEMLALDAASMTLLASEVAPAGVSTVRFTSPGDRLGVVLIRATPVLDAGRADRAYGRALTVPVLIRPAAPSFPRLELDRDLYLIRGEATLTVHTPPDAPESWAAVLVRDLAQHQGEEPFQEWFLRRALSRSILDPSTPEADLLVRAALTELVRGRWGWGSERDVERDPVAEAAEYREEIIGRWMVAVEELLARALEGGTVGTITTGDGASRRFVENVVELALAEAGETPRTLGGGEVTVDLMRAFDASFTFDRVARRVARRRLVRLLQVLAAQLDPEDAGVSRPRGRATAPPERWLSELVRRGALSPEDLRDPWGGTFVLRRTGRTPAFTVAVEAEGYELLSPGPDGRVGTADDVADPLARVVPEGTPYARASGEDRLMAQLAALSPGAAVLDDLVAAYARLNDEALEELIGDGLRGGGGYGSGYGRGAGGLSGRRARVPRIRTGSAAVRGMPPLAGVVREDFPATLLFRPEVALDSGGRTTLPIALADAPTTYLVEVVLWRADGWVWSDSTRLRVDQDLLVDAPVPASATAGDVLRLPVRLANRTGSPRSVRVRLAGDDAFGVEPIAAGPVTVPARDAVEVPVTLRLERPAAGRLTVAALDAGTGAALDAVRRPLEVRPPRRRVSDEASAVLRGSGSLSLTVPHGASPDGVNQVVLAVGPAIFRREDHETWERWRDALVNPEHRPAPEVTDWELRQLTEGADLLVLARLVGVDWGNPRVADVLVARGVEVIRDQADGLEAESAGDVRTLARVLTLIAPALRRASARRGPDRALRALARTLRRRLGDAAALFADAPWLSARVAAALLLSSSDASVDARTEELLRRAWRGVVAVGDERWLEGGRDDEGDELFVGTCLLALAEIAAGRDAAAFPLLRSMIRLYRSSDGNMPEVRHLSAEDRALAAAAAAALGGGRVPGSLAIMLDGERREVALEDGVGALAAEELGAGGEHEVALVDAGTALVLVRLHTEHTVSWDTPAPEVGPLAVSFEGEAGAFNHRSELFLVVRNRVPRVLHGAVVEVELPAGVEIDEEARARISPVTRGRIDVGARRMRMQVRPLCPRSTLRIPIAWIWNAAGSLQGLGVAAWADDRPSAATVLPLRRVEVGAVTGGTP